MNTRWRTSRTAIFNIGFHLIWCPKYRLPVLIGPVAKRLKTLLREKATAIGATIKSMEVMPDHVHLFVQSPPTNAPHYIVQQLKGYTSHTLRQEFPALKSRLPSLWTRSYFCESVGHFSQATVEKYIAEQKRR